MVKGNYAALAAKMKEKAAKASEDPRNSVDQQKLDEIIGGAAYTDSRTPVEDSTPPKNKKTDRRFKAPGEKGVRQNFLLQQRYIDALDKRLESLPRSVSKTDLVKLGISIVANLPESDLKDYLTSEFDLKQEQDGA